MLELIAFVHMLKVGHDVFKSEVPGSVSWSHFFKSNAGHKEDFGMLVDLSYETLEA